ncbi:MAG: polyketide cyclase [Ferruginibacter sp.]|nr:polyketide cyclase [Ferruginibacter sp.]
MKTLKKIVLIILVLIAIPFVIALFVKREYFVEREVTINRPKQEVFNYVKYLKNQENYSKWVRMDPNMKKDYRGTDGTIGFVYAWDGNSEAGKGEQEIKDLKDGEKVDVEIRFEKPFEGIATAPITTEMLSANQTKVRWSLKGKSKYPMNFMNLFMDNMLGKDLETSLAMLKGVLEKPGNLSSKY